MIYYKKLKKTKAFISEKLNVDDKQTECTLIYFLLLI